MAGGVLLAVVLVAGCDRGVVSDHLRMSAPASGSVASGVTGAPSRGPVPPAIRWRAWHGPVEELFVHPLVIEPKLAFTADRLGIGFQDFFVTALEFRRILDQLWAKGWTLVDVHRAAQGTVRVPAGRRPLVLSEDDVNYYHYFDGRGLAQRLVLDGGRVHAELPGGRLSEDDVVPLVEAEVARHPEFSADGAKGVLAVTAYEGLLGEHHPNFPGARKRLTVLAQWLTGHGWTIASHTWGHIDLSRSSPADIARDTAQWKALAGPFFGHTDVLIYPFGARPDEAARRQLVAAGYRIQLDIDVVARHVHTDGAIIMSRRHVDGFAFAAPGQQSPFNDVGTVRDPARPH